LECGDGVFGVAALGQGALGDLERCHQQSGDFADSVTALQNLAADSMVQSLTPPQRRRAIGFASR